MSGNPSSSRRRLYVLLVILVACVFAAWAQRQWLARFPNSLARSALLERDPRRALWWLEKSSWLSDRNGETEFLLSRAYRNVGQLDDSRNHLQAAWAKGWPTEVLEREQALGLAQAGQMGQAEPYLSRLLEDAGEDGPEICEAFVIGYLKTRNFDAAGVLLATWTQDHPNDAQPHFWRALIEREFSRAESAEKSLRWALELKPDHYGAALMLADLLLEDRKNAAEALPYYELARKGPAQVESASIGMARCLRSLGRRDEAAKELAMARKKFPNQPQLVFEHANLLLDAGSYQEARVELEPWLKRSPKDKDLRYAYGVALRGVGEVAQATAHLEYATTASKELMRIQPLVYQANQEPKNAALRYEIGHVLLEYGDEREGLIWLESALQIDGRHQPTHTALARYYESKAASQPREFGELAAMHKKLAELSAAAAPAKTP